MRKEVLVLLVILFAMPVIADDESVLQAEKAKLSMFIQADMKLKSVGVGYYTNYVQADLSFVPRNTPQQEINSLNAEPEPDNQDGIYRFRWEEPAMGTIGFEVDAVISTTYHLAEVDEKVAFPITAQEIPTNIHKYMQESEYIDSNNAGIVKLASQLAQGEDDLFKVVFNIAEWVMTNLRYDISVGRRVESASWILEHKRGVCDEYSTLFIGLVRSLGIPARYISGMAYSNLDIIQGFGPHAWVEVYFPGFGWIPFDFTYAELGYVDASHIKLKNSLDPGESSTKYEWEGYLVSLDTEPLYMEVEILGIGDQIEPLLDIDVSIAKDNVGFGSYNLVEVNLENTHNYYVPTAIQLSRTNGFDIEEERKFLLLPPASSGKLSWIGQVSDGLDSKYEYTFPIGAYTSRNGSDEATFKAKEGEPVYSLEDMEALLEQSEKEEAKSYSKDVQLSCISDQEALYANSSVVITCDIENLGNSFLEGISVCISDTCNPVDLGIGRSETVNFELSFSEIGKREIRISAENDEVSKTAFVMIDVQIKPVLEIHNITHPEIVNSSERFSVEFTIKKVSKSAPLNLKVLLTQGIQKKEWNIKELDSDRRFIINLNGNALLRKENEFAVSVSYSGLEGEPYQTEERFTIILEDPSFTSRAILWSESVIGGIDTVDWKVLAMTAIVFGLVIGLVFKKRKRRTLW